MHVYSTLPWNKRRCTVGICDNTNTIQYKRRYIHYRPSGYSVCEIYYNVLVVIEKTEDEQIQKCPTPRVLFAFI